MNRVSESPLAASSYDVSRSSSLGSSSTIDVISSFRVNHSFSGFTFFNE